MHNGRSLTLLATPHSMPPSFSQHTQLLLPHSPSPHSPPALRSSSRPCRTATSACRRGRREQLLEQVDTYHRGEIDFSEWAAAMADWRSVRFFSASGHGSCKRCRLQPPACPAGRPGPVLSRSAAALGSPVPPARPPLLRPHPCSPTRATSPASAALQFKAGNDWDRLVADAFKSMDPDNDGLLSGEDLERLLCGDDGCEVPGRGKRDGGAGAGMAGAQGEQTRMIAVVGVCGQPL